MARLSYNGNMPKLIIQVAGLPTRTLYPGEKLVIGRSPAAGLRLKDPSVSRKHAEIRWDGAWPVIKDLGSSAGTLVDDEEVERALLDRIHSIWLGNTLLETWMDETEDSYLITDEPVRLIGEVGRDLTGWVHNRRDLIKVLRSFEVLQRTGQVFLKKGKLVLALGKIVYAESGSLRGLSALREILNSTGRLSFTTAIDLVEADINISPKELRDGEV